MSGTESGGVLEGFLCPMCLQDLGTISQLQQHFETTHSNADQDVLHSIKGFIGKAKRKILKQEEESGVVGAAVAPHAGFVQVEGEEEPQEPGVTRRHTDYFKRTRNARMQRYATETNKLIIRMHRLLLEAPSDPVKRKAHEKGLVPWIEDEHVNLCPHCARGFHVARRKHHCRLCGGIMCDDCSCFATQHYAKKLTGTMKPEVDSSLLRRGSSSSLGSYGDESDWRIRICPHCHMSLDGRLRSVETRGKGGASPLVQLYSRLMCEREEAERLLGAYRGLAVGLREGRTNCRLDQAKELFGKLQASADRIDRISKMVVEAGAGVIPGTREGILREKIRSAAAQFLTHNFLGLPPLPTEEDLRTIQERRRMEAHQRLAEESRVAQQQYERVKRESPKRKVATAAPKPPSEGGGWSPQAAVLGAGQEEDPMLQQIRIIKSYLQQAREAGKTDEVMLLEANLTELRAEYRRQQQHQRNLTS